MNGDNLINSIRIIMRDKESSSQQGMEWSDREIILALNSAQDVFINYCIRNKHFYLLLPLLTESQLFDPIIDGSPINMSTHIQFQTQPFLYFSSGYIGEQQKVARFYYGGELDSMLYVGHTMMGIIGNYLYIKDNGIAAKGKLNYYKKPSYIGSTNLGDGARTDFTDKSFDDYIYNNIIMEHAIILLGMKEIQTQREFKKENKTIQETAIYPAGIANYINNNETPQFKIIQQQIEMAKMQNG